jgi:fucose permease
VILFFTCAAAALGPLAMGAVSDWLGHPRYGFVLATVFAALLFAGLLFNVLVNPAKVVLQQREERDYVG